MPPLAWRDLLRSGFYQRRHALLRAGRANPTNVENPDSDPKVALITAANAEAQRRQRRAAVSIEWTANHHQTC